MGVSHSLSYTSLIWLVCMPNVSIHATSYPLLKLAGLNERSIGTWNGT